MKEIEKQLRKNNKGQLWNAAEFKTMLSNGWELSIDYCKKDTDSDTLETNEYWITEEQLKEVHACVYETFKEFGLPGIGDFIDAGHDLDKVVERQFSFHNSKKQVVLTVV